jgi:hypothetical protein
MQYQLQSKIYWSVAGGSAFNPKVPTYQATCSHNSNEYRKNACDVYEILYFFNTQFLERIKEVTIRSDINRKRFFSKLVLIENLLYDFDLRSWFIYFLWLCSPVRVWPPRITRFLDHTQRRARIGTTVLDEC